jgi:hypothetical protein
MTDSDRDKLFGYNEKKDKPSVRMAKYLLREFPGLNNVFEQRPQAVIE